MWVGGQPHASSASTLRKEPVPIVQEAGWAPGPVWTGAKNLSSARIRSPDRPARSQSFPLGTRHISLILNVLIGSGAIFSPIQWVTGALSPGVKRSGREANHIHLILRLRKNGAVPPLY